MACEHFKEAERKLMPRKRRKSLELLLGMESFGGHGTLMEREAFLELKKIQDGLVSQRAVLGDKILFAPRAENR